MVMFTNMMYSFVGSIEAGLLMLLFFVIFDKITPFDTSKELAKGNVAVGVLLAGIAIGLGLTMGLVIASSLN